VRLGYYSQRTLAQVQAQEFREQQSTRKRYFAWFVAEFSVVLTDLPEVIGIGIALNLFFGWPYWVGVMLSLLTTMSFLATQNFGMHVLEYVIFGFVGIMSVALFVEMSFVDASGEKIVQGWLFGFVDVTSQDLFTIAGIMGSVVMPHNLYLHTATVQSRKVLRQDDVVKKAVWYCSIEPILPILVSFFVNMAVVAIAAESVYGQPNAEYVGLTDFCNYFVSLKGGCVLWGVALLAAGQSR
jgi:NRAMP (natural resistance-associated macrophage protein)-like metal ion transporter